MASFIAQSMAFAARRLAGFRPGKVLSGSSWVDKFSKSSSLDDLDSDFKTCVTNFISAVEAGGASKSVISTKRPAERQYLMYWSYQVAVNGTDPETVPEMDGVNIDWVHRDAQGKVNAAASARAAQEMVKNYGIVYEPGKTSRHSEGKAIDMYITWTAEQLTVKDAQGNDVIITGTKGNSNTQLHTVGKSYGVIKLVKDVPHWSTDGH